MKKTTAGILALALTTVLSAAPQGAGQSGPSDQKTNKEKGKHQRGKHKKEGKKTTPSS